VEAARSGKGPQLVEAVTYRMSMHTTADDPTRYRTEKEVKEWKKRDPIDRFRKYLQQKKLWTKAYEAKLSQRVTKEVDGAVEKAEAWKGSPRDMFKYVWAEMTDDLKSQMAEMERLYGLEGSR
jgi:pyruvate dehydrogenase E1 component alpha subunit